MDTELPKIQFYEGGTATTTPNGNRKKGGK